MVRIIIAAIVLLLSHTLLIAQNSVKIHEGVKIGGKRQWIGAVSNDDSKPLLLFLHGGPGFSSRAYSKKFIKYLKKDFIIAQWDQRGTGITAAWEKSTDVPTIDLMHNDTKEVVNYLLKRFKKKKLYLVGFSWGGFLGLHFANEYPELLHAYISVSSMIHGNESESRSLQIIREKAKSSNHTQAIEELSKINTPFSSWQELYFQRKWTAYFSDNSASHKSYPKALFESWSQKWMEIFLEASAIDYSEAVSAINCPIYFFLSNKDLVSNYTVTEEFIDGLVAKRKEVVWFNESTHEIPNQSPKKFSEELLKISQSLN